MNNQNNVFNIISWNIQGLKTRLKPTKQTISNTKLNIKSIKSKLSKFDIICLQETWAKDETLTFQGYTVYSTVKNTVSKRGQAGVSVLIRDHHQNFVSRIHSDSPNIIWCRLDKQLLGLQADIFLAAVYLPPLQSQRKAGEDVISILEKEIHKYSTQGQILLLGDFNARTGTLNDFIENDADDFLTIHNTYNRDTHCPKRNNADYTINKVGREILRLCVGNRLRILNGRLTGDLDGKYTCYQTNGASTVDYALASEDLIKTILGFQVQALTTYSDHCPISLKLTSSRSHVVKDNASRQPLRKTAPTQKNFKKFLWKADSKDKFLSALSNPNVQRLFDSFNSEHHPSVDDEISQFNKIINSVAKLCLATSRKTSKTTKEKKPWYDHTCRQLKKQLQQ